MLNIVALMGRMTATPELRHTPNGVATCSFNIAVERSFVRAGEERKADFITIVTWQKTAEFVCKYFTKGNMIAINGLIQTRNYEDKNGNKRTAFEVLANNVHFAESSKKEGNSKAAEQPNESAFQRSGSDEFEEINGDDDLPF